jgi:uncharacterized protein YecE (DUF72 family)
MPDNFIFSGKIPRIITPEKILFEGGAEFEQFVDTMEILDENLVRGYFNSLFFNRSVFKSQSDFLDRFIPFVKTLPHDYKFVVEMRNKDWLNKEFADLLPMFKSTSLPESLIYL